MGSSLIVGAVINGWDYSDPPYASACIFFLMAHILFFVFQVLPTPTPSTLPPRPRSPAAPPAPYLWLLNVLFYVSSVWVCA